MKPTPSILVSFVVGAVIASLPYTLSAGKANAQGAGPAQGQGFPPPQGGGFGGGVAGQPGNPGPGQFRYGGQPMVNSMTTSGNYLFAASGDTIYKIQIDTMSIIGQTRLPQSRQAGQQGGQGQNRNQNGRPQQGGGLSGGGSIPPKK
jgi:hypothetical protein